MALVHSDLDFNSKEDASLKQATGKRLFLSLGWLDRLLPILILLFMIAGCALGATTGDAVPKAFDQVKFKGVSFRASVWFAPVRLLIVAQPSRWAYSS
jgi:hypothetical protein